MVWSSDDVHPSRWSPRGDFLRQLHFGGGGARFEYPSCLTDHRMAKDRTGVLWQRQLALIGVGDSISPQHSPTQRRPLNPSTISMSCTGQRGSRAGAQAKGGCTNRGNKQHYITER
ncbi:hypothetical protein H2248_002237 [Termitomyces sp. 'cryptogamus']|nr:hypothetical protein H2248_002237 [Termitomyces sp. 'cryptogamus']